MQLFDNKRKSTTKLIVDEREAECCEQLWAWIVAQRMEVYIIDVKTADVDCNLHQVRRPENKSPVHGSLPRAEHNDVNKIMPGIEARWRSKESLKDIFSN